MKTLKRNRMTIWYALATGNNVRQVDSFGRYTGETVPEYADPVEYDRLSTRNRKGIIKTEPFGITDDYVDSFVTDDMNCPIKADTRLWIGTNAYDTEGNIVPHTHIVEGIIPSLNVIRILARNVNVSK